MGSNGHITAIITKYDPPPTRRLHPSRFSIEMGVELPRVEWERRRPVNNKKAKATETNQISCDEAIVQLHTK